MNIYTYIYIYTHMETYIHIQIKQDSINDFWRHLSEVVNLALERHRESFVEAKTATSNLKIAQNVISLSVFPL